MGLRNWVRLWPSEVEPHHDDPPVREIDHTDDDPGPKGGLTMEVIYAGLPEEERARFADKYLAAQPEQLVAGQQRRTQQIRAVLTLLLFVAIVAEAGVAAYVVNVAETASWDTVKDWLSLSLAPLTAAAAIAAAFWFPTGGKE